MPLLGIYPVFMMQLLCFAMFACAYNLLLGFSGMLSFGHAAFFGSATYATCWLVTALHWGTVPAILAGIVVSAILGAIIGAIAIRRRGIYFAHDHFGPGADRVLRLSRAKFTGGENGIQGVPRGTLLGIVPLRSDIAMYYFVLAVFVLVFLFIYRIVHSPFGQVLKAIRDNGPRATSLGYDINRHRLVGLHPVGGHLGPGRIDQGLGAGFATLSDVQQSTSGLVILMPLIGGTGTFFGR